MENDKEIIVKYQTIRKDLEKDIIAKLSLIKEKVLTSTTGTITSNIQILAYVNDELDDVLLNWNINPQDLDEEDDD